MLEYLITLKEFCLDAIEHNITQEKLMIAFCVILFFTTIFLKREKVFFSFPRYIHKRYGRVGYTCLMLVYGFLLGTPLAVLFNLDVFFILITMAMFAFDNDGSHLYKEGDKNRK